MHDDPVQRGRFDALCHPVPPSTRGALQAAWQRLPERLRTETQFLGRQYAGLCVQGPDRRAPGLDVRGQRAGDTGSLLRNAVIVFAGVVLGSH
jgi:hypothetical protein